MMIKYPKELNTIFSVFKESKIRPVIVGGYVRDYLLGLPSKDIDVELYNVTSLDTVEQLLKKFGKVSSVGKSFGVVKLLYNGLDLDFSLPRKENKTAKGHKGFSIDIDKNLDFKEAAHRRDFTINAIGYDVIEKKILDPYDGIGDLNKKLITAVDLKTFKEDPLRILRAAAFRARFCFEIEKNLFLLMQIMVQNKELEELAKERIYEEFKKIFLKGEKPSLAFWLLESLGAFKYHFEELDKLSYNEHYSTFKSLDNFVKIKSEAKESDEIITIMLALLVRYIKEKESFLRRVTEKKRVIQDVLTLSSISTVDEYKEDYAIYKLAQKVSIRRFLLYLKAIGIENLQLQKRSRQLHVYETPLQAYIKGKDLIKIGMKPSVEFKEILADFYEKQMRGTFSSKEEALKYLQKSSF